MAINGGGNVSEMSLRDVKFLSEWKGNVCQEVKGKALSAVQLCLSWTVQANCASVAAARLMSKQLTMNPGYNG